MVEGVHDGRGVAGGLCGLVVECGAVGGTEEGGGDDAGAGEREEGGDREAAVLRTAKTATSAARPTMASAAGTPVTSLPLTDSGNASPATVAVPIDQR